MIFAIFETLFRFRKGNHVFYNVPSMGQFSICFVRWNAKINFLIFFSEKPIPLCQKMIFESNFCFIGCHLPWNWWSRRNFEKKMKIVKVRSQKCSRNLLISADYGAKSIEINRNRVIFSTFLASNFCYFHFFFKIPSGSSISR